jgi:hypothetical protein
LVFEISTGSSLDRKDILYWKKLFFLGIKKRPQEALLMTLEKKLFPNKDKVDGEIGS